jgi:hypothetical protein
VYCLIKFPFFLQYPTKGVREFYIVIVRLEHVCECTIFSDVDRYAIIRTLLDSLSTYMWTGIAIPEISLNKRDCSFVRMLIQGMMHPQGCCRRGLNILSVPKIDIWRCEGTIFTMWKRKPKFYCAVCCTEWACIRHQRDRGGQSTVTLEIVWLVESWICMVGGKTESVTGVQRKLRKAYGEERCAVGVNT